MATRPTQRPRQVGRPVHPSPPGFWARWWASPVNKARLIAPLVLLLIYYFFFRD